MLSLYVCSCSGYGCADCASLFLMGILGYLCPGYRPVIFSGFLCLGCGLVVSMVGFLVDAVTCLWGLV